MDNLSTFGFKLINPLGFAYLYKNTNSIFLVEYRGSEPLELKHAKKLVEVISQLKLSNYKGIIAYAAHPQFHINSEARKYFSKHEIMHIFNKQAIVTQNLSTKILASFFVKVDQPIIETKVFKNIKNSIDWIIEE